jgi:endopeptidase La
MEQIDNDDTQISEITVTYQDVEEDLQPGEAIVREHVSTMETEVIFKNTKLFTKQLIKDLKSEDYIVSKMNILADFALGDTEDRIKYLQSESHIERFDWITEHITNHIDNIGREVPTPTGKPHVVKRASKPRPHNAESIKARFRSLPISKETRSYIQREINKLDSLPKSSTEHSMVLDYMSWVLDLPWNTYSSKEFDLHTLTNQLDATHHGLSEVKQHVLEHMTIEKIRGKSAGTVLCFVGEPGTGKTSIAKEIAKVTNRELVRIAMGGLSDEAEIRGHRRTYIGSRPGRLITGLKKAGTLDPIFLLDEIDKITTHKGDPFSALLEVLDKEQQDHFVDRYLEIPIDLSRTMFICTANYEEQIPEALKDRMEIIYFQPYVREEKAVIAKKYLIPKAFKDLNLINHDILFTNDAIDYLSQLRNVRTINKKIHKLLRMAAVDIMVRDKEKILINQEYLETLPKEKAKTSVGF